MERIAIDLLWLRPGKVGGTEFYIRNLLDGFLQLNRPFEFTLLVSKDNRKSFEHYAQDKRITLLEANVVSANIAKRILWQFFFQNRLLRKHKLYRCFVPVYCRPVFNGGVTYINTIHDLQAAHYPEYHPFHEIAYSKLCWWVDARSSKKIIATTNYVKSDLIERYKIKDDKIEVLNIPAMVNLNEITSLETVEKKFNISDGQYYYTVAQMIPHKNLETLIRVMAELRDRRSRLPLRLLVSGISGNASENVKKLIRDNQLDDIVTLTGFISNEERNALYRHCRAFLFPSIFEGFGMPPIEAMAFGAVVITTDRTSIPEVTQGKANYVDDPFDVDAWISKMEAPEKKNDEFDFSIYSRTYLADKYMDYLQQNLK
ncbi:MAG: glycosyltransferase family 4 protein [Lachnospiraceae bacterium]|nr:glycosyltransferase family 4 protein [Lachnospiraceae bacterium]